MLHHKLNQLNTNMTMHRTTNFYYVGHSGSEEQKQTTCYLETHTKWCGYPRIKPLMLYISALESFNKVQGGNPPKYGPAYNSIQNVFKRIMVETLGL